MENYIMKDPFRELSIASEMPLRGVRFDSERVLSRNGT